jgi:FixJ family two-component response regulator
VRSTEPIVLVVDDDASVREALASLIGSVGLLVECFASPAEFLRRRRNDAPSCLVLDVRMPGMSGLDLQHRLAHGEHRIPIIFITAHGDIPMAVRAMKEGAVEFLPKPFRDEDLLSAIREALDRESASRERRAEILGIRSRYTRLTPRQSQILGMIVEGKLNKQIAAHLGVSENTVKVHRHRIMEKMGATSVANLARMVERLERR